MIRPLEVEAARERLLHRAPLDEFDAPAETLVTLATATGRPCRSAEEGVARIVADVRARGDAALRHYAAALDRSHVERLELDDEALEGALARCDPELRAALERSADRIRRFHERQAAREQGWQEEFGDSTLGQLVRPLERIGIYAPGGRALYPSSVLMAAIPARVAGVEEIVMISPPSRARLGAGGDAAIADVILAAAAIAGVDRVFAIGGAQGIAALAYGTESVPAVDKIVGPGGLFTVLAMRRVFGVTGIAALPGPTETLLIADASADPALVAADLLAQAEHDVLARALLLTPDRELARAVSAALDEQLERLPRREIIEESFQRGSGIVLTRDLVEAVELANEFAPEHLCLLVAEPWELVDKVRHAGGVFVGELACEALGDYVVGPSHIMPTGRTARFASPLNVRDFQKIISLFGVGERTLRESGPAAIRVAEAEGLDAHAAAIRRRLE